MFRTDLSSRHRRFNLRRSLVTLGLCFFAVTASAQVSTTTDISSLNTTTTLGTPITQQVAGAGTGEYDASTTYSVTYEGNVTSINSFTAGATNYQPLSYAGTISTTLVRNLSNNSVSTSPNNNLLWNSQVSSSGNSITVASPYIGNEQAAFNANNLNVGTDNIFGNTGDGNGDNNNIERVDVVFNQGLSATTALAFAIMERGASNAHDPFGIAAITGINGSGVPTSFGSLIEFGSGSTYGTYGASSLVASGNWLVARNNPANTGALATSPSTTVTGQTLGGVVVSVTGSTANSGLGISAGSTIYGYSLFGGDVTGTNGQVLTDITTFPQNTSSSTGAGGIDPVAYTGVAFQAVPEPSSLLAVASAAFLPLLRRRRKRPVI